MAVLPDVQPIPVNIDPGILARIEYLQNIAIPGAMPNRWLTGTQESSALQQGTLGLNQQQAAATPYKGDVTAIAEGIETLLQMGLEAVAYWDREAPKSREKVYALRAISDAPVLRNPPSDGDAVKLTPDKLRHPYKLVVSADADTAQDKAQKEQSAMARYAGGWTTKAKAMKDMGEADPERAIEEIEKEKAFERQKQFFQPVIDQQVKRLTMALTGISVDPMQAQAMGAPAGGGQPDMERQTANQGTSYPTPATTAAPVGVPSTSTGGVMV
jgi:hypothetical protein